MNKLQTVLYLVKNLAKAMIIVLILITIFTNFIYGQPANSPWPMYHHDLQHTGRSIYKGPEEPNMKWSVSAHNWIQSSAAIGLDGTIYVGSSDYHLYAINSDGTIYIGADDDQLYAISPDGKIKRSFSTGGNIVSCPAIGLDGTIYVGSFDHKLYAINSDGSLQWNYTTGSLIWGSSPAIDANGTIYVGSFDNKL